MKTLILTILFIINISLLYSQEPKSCTYTINNIGLWQGSTEGISNLKSKMIVTINFKTKSLVIVNQVDSFLKLSGSYTFYKLHKPLNTFDYLIDSLQKDGKSFSGAGYLTNGLDEATTLFLAIEGQKILMPISKCNCQY